MATMNSGRGGFAGYGENSFSASPDVMGGLDDGTVAIDVTSVFGDVGINAFGTSYTDIYINSNGLISFGVPNSDFYTDGGLDSSPAPAIVPFWSDIDVGEGGDIYWDVDPGSGRITVTWDDVQPYSGGPANSFKVVITATRNGDFDLDVIYEAINFSEIKQLVLTENNDSVDAAASWSGLNGDRPGERIDGRGGDDTITGGRGGDTLEGGATTTSSTENTVTIPCQADRAKTAYSGAMAMTRS